MSDIAPSGGGYEELSDDEGPTVKLVCTNCGFRSEKPEACMCIGSLLSQMRPLFEMGR